MSSLEAPQSDSSTETVEIPKDVEKPAEATTEEVTDPNGCEPEQYWAEEYPHYCIDKGVVVSAQPAPTNPSANVQLGRVLAGAKGWNGSQWTCLYNLWQKESGWDNHAQNPTSTAYGIAQFLNGTWAGTGYSKTPDPEIQIKAGLTYIKNRYGTPCGAWQHSVENNWY